MGMNSMWDYPVPLSIEENFRIIADRYLALIESDWRVPYDHPIHKELDLAAEPLLTLSRKLFPNIYELVDIKKPIY